MTGSTIVKWFSFLWYIVMFPPINSEEDTVRNGDMRVWYSQSFKINGKGSLWDKKDSFVKTCGTGEEAEFWFVTEHVNLTTTFAEAIHVDVEAGFRLCFAPNRSAHVRCHSNYFEVYMYRGENSSRLSFKKLSDFLDIFTPIYKITNNTSLTENVITSTQTFSFYQMSSQGVTFAIRSRGACGSMFKMKMYHNYCGETFSNGIKFERTSSPLNGFKIVSGNCSVNSTWNIPRMNSNKKNCSDNGNCSHDSSANVPRKNVTSLMNLNRNCSDNSTCSDNSSDNSLKNNVAPKRPQQYCYDNGTWSPLVRGDLTCSCREGFSLNTDDGSCSLCSDTSYRKNISTDGCIQCPNNTVANMERTSCICDEGFYNASRDTTTMPCYALPVMKKLSAKSFVNGVNISWIMPDNSLGGPIEYDVECFICNQTECNISCTNEQYDPRQKDLNQTWVIVSNLTSPKKYMFRVYPRNILNADVAKTEWNYTEIAVEILPARVLTTTNKPKPEEDSNFLLYIVIGVGSLLLLILIAFLIIFVLTRRRHKEKRSRNAYVNQGVELPDAGRRLYVDPSNYDDPEEAVLEFTNELDPKSIFLEKMIGGGAFGDVYKGELTENKTKIPIAVKTLKHDADEKSSRDFMLEASVMGQFDDPNIVRMEGVVTKSTPRMIVLEYMINGSLDNYLKSNDCMLTNLQLIGMARGVSHGMKYLSEINFVHRDLAARNVLVNENLFCKIADFGLSRELEANDSSRGEYSTSGGKIPVRWTAPEAVKRRKFSSASDVWSFGILLWEIMSFADRPYPVWDNLKVLEQIDKGYRLPPPDNCPKVVHDLMLHCWKADRNERPSFAQITVVIDEWIRSPETMEDEINQLTMIGEWLTSLKMSSYKTKFVDAGYNRKSEIIELTDEDLQNIGVSLIGHRNKIMKGIYSLKSKKKTDSLRV